MARRKIVFNNEQIKFFSPNQRRAGEYNSTIENDTANTLTIEVSNQSENYGETPTFADPAAGTLTVSAGANGVLNEPYKTWRLTSAVATTGSVYIVEAG